LAQRVRFSPRIRLIAMKLLGYKIDDI